MSQHTCWLRRHAARISDDSARYAADPSVLADVCVLADVYDKPHALRSLGASNAAWVTILSDGAEWPGRARERELRFSPPRAGWVLPGFGYPPFCARSVNGLSDDQREQRRE